MSEKKQNPPSIMKDAILHLEENYPKAKIVIGESAIHFKQDSLFGGILAYDVKSETDLSAIRNLIVKLNEIFM